MSSLGFDTQSYNALEVMTEDVLRNAEIEGMLLNPDHVRSSVARHLGLDCAGMPEADHLIIQSQIPYTATLAISDKLTVLEMRSYIVAEEKRGQFLCEFHNTDRFLCAILTARSGIRIIEPAWLREKLLHMARKAIDNNSDL